MINRGLFLLWMYSLYSPLPKVNDILEYDHIQLLPQSIRHYTKSCPCYRTGPYRVWPFWPNSERFLIEHFATLTPPQLVLCHGLAKIRWPFHFEWCYTNVTLYSNNQLWWYILYCKDKKMRFPVIYNIIMLDVFIYVYLKNKGTKHGLFGLLCCCT